MPFNVNSAAIVALRDSGRFSTSQIQSIIARANQIEINQAAGQPTLRLAGVANELVSPALGEFTSAAYSDVVRQRIQDAVNGIDPVGLSVFIERDGRFYPSLDGSDLPNGAMYAVPISSYVTASMPIDRVKPQIVVGDWALLPNISLVELKSKFDHEVSHVIRDLIQKNGQVVASVLAETSLNLNQRFEKLLRVNLDDEATALIAEFNSRRRSGQSDAVIDAQLFSQSLSSDTRSLAFTALSAAADPITRQVDPFATDAATRAALTAAGDYYGRLPPSGTANVGNVQISYRGYYSRYVIETLANRGFLNPSENGDLAVISNTTAADSFLSGVVYNLATVNYSQARTNFSAKPFVYQQVDSPSPASQACLQGKAKAPWCLCPTWTCACTLPTAISGSMSSPTRA